MLPFPKLFITLFLVSLVAHSGIANPEVCRIDTERFARETLNEYYWLHQVGTIGSQKVPLVIVLHGGGGCGDSLKSLQKIKGQSQGVCRGIERYKKSPCIVVAPQCLRRTINGEKILGLERPELFSRASISDSSCGCRPCVSNRC